LEKEEEAAIQSRRTKRGLAEEEDGAELTNRVKNNQVLDESSLTLVHQKPQIIFASLGTSHGEILKADYSVLLTVNQGKRQQ